MAMTLDDFLVSHPVDRELVEVHKARMLAEVRAYQLRELREQAGLTQSEVAERIGVGQRQISKIERGDLNNARVGTIRGYLEAIGGAMAIEFVAGDAKLQIA
jgi:predicted transcriptional regulator